MKLNEIVGHKNQITRLKTYLKNKPQPASGSFLFSGPQGVGKKAVALGLAQSLLCSSPNQGLACGACPSCIKTIKEQHPDLLVIDAEGSQTIKVDALRNVLKFMSLKSFEGQGKVVIIDEAHLMTAQGANSILKTLEEPPENSFFVLISQRKKALLPTIQSRCMNLQFGNLTSEELQKILGPLDPAILALSQGRCDLGQNLKDESFEKTQKSAQEAIRALRKGKTVYEGFSLMNQLAQENKPQFHLVIQLWFHWIKEASITAKENVLSGVSPKALSLWAQKIARLESDIASHVNKGLAFEKFYLDSMLLLGAEPRTTK